LKRPFEEGIKRVGGIFLDQEVMRRPPVKTLGIGLGGKEGGEVVPSIWGGLSASSGKGNILITKERHVDHRRI